MAETEEQLIAKAKEGKAYHEFRESPVCQQVLTDVQDMIVTNWVANRTKPEIAKELWHRMCGFSSFKDFIDHKINTGNEALRQLDLRHSEGEQGQGARPLLGGKARKVEE